DGARLRQRLLGRAHGGRVPLGALRHREGGPLELDDALRRAPDGSGRAVGPSFRRAAGCGRDPRRGMILRRFGSRIHEVKPSFDARAMREISFLRGSALEESADEWLAAHERIGEHRLTATASSSGFDGSTSAHIWAAHIWALIRIIRFRRSILSSWRRIAAIVTAL